MNLGPDERIYAAQADDFRADGFKSFRPMAEVFLATPELHAHPSPLRWLWTIILALTPMRWVQTLSWAILGPLAVWALGLPWLAAVWVAASPLAFIGGRRILQDVPIAALTLACLGFALHGNAIGLAVCLFVLLSCKEAALFCIPALLAAWWMSGAAILTGAVAFAIGLFAWVGSLLLIFGRLTVPLFRTARAGHNTEYTHYQQKGAAHRLLVDLVLLSPVAVAAAFWVHNPLVLSLAGALLIAHAMAPVRNIRLVLAADLLLRCTVLPWWLLPVALAADIYIIRYVRFVYDPITQFLTDSLHMSRPKA